MDTHWEAAWERDTRWEAAWGRDADRGSGRGKYRDPPREREAGKPTETGRKPPFSGCEQPKRATAEGGKATPHTAHGAPRTAPHSNTAEEDRKDMQRPKKNAWSAMRSGPDEWVSAHPENTHRATPQAACEHPSNARAVGSARSGQLPGPAVRGRSGQKPTPMAKRWTTREGTTGEQHHTAPMTPRTHDK